MLINYDSGVYIAHEGIAHEGIPELRRNNRGRVVCKLWDFEDLLGKKYRSYQGFLVEISCNPRPHFKKIRPLTSEDYEKKGEAWEPTLYVAPGEFIYFD